MGNAYPTYASYKAVLSGSPDEHKQWLTFWLVYTLFTIAEMGGDALISWLPLYWEAKIACVVWLSMFGGATTIYNSFVRLFLEKYESAIDAQVDKMSAAAGGAVSDLSKSGIGMVQQHGTKLAATGLQWLATANAAVSNTAGGGARQ